MDEKLQKIVEEKEKATKLKGIIQGVEKRIKKKTKNSRKLVKAIDSFVACNLSNKAIYSKYEYLRNVMESMGYDEHSTEVND